ncbi:CAP domain-containing protein [Cytobacillus gottheilii]|uniref:Sporulation protein n=1 Tax=Cytobacillus gottheilii TaxID=859144 RepID=A0ABX8FA58_9BACI|nr:CAP domain-containing protein [Cytobacillus gottheilii]QVY60027.1 sporulation protein [Cytobacillus gottheilii]
MNKKMIFSVAAAATLLMSAPGINKADAASPVQAKVESKVYHYQASNVNFEQINSILQKYMKNYYNLDLNALLQKTAIQQQAKQETAVKTPVQTEKPKTEAPAKAPVQTEKPKAEAPAKAPVQAEKPKTEAPVKAPVQTEKPKTEAPAKAPVQTEKPKAETTAPTANTQTKAPAQSNTATQAKSQVSAFEQQVLDLTNAERAKYGVPALKLDTELSKVAREKSNDMKAKGYFDHNSPTYGSPFDMMKQFGISYKTAGENIAMGQRSPQEVVTAWMNSEGHRKNILNANFTHLGVGHLADGNYWTQMFIGK